MTKISKKALLQIVKEEYNKALKRKDLTDKIKTINEKIETSKKGSISEVHAGAEMHGGDHEGQPEAKFDMKGTSLIEDTIDEVIGTQNIHVDGNDIKFHDRKIGAITNGKMQLDKPYDTMFNVPAIDAMVKLDTATKSSTIPSQTSTSMSPSMAENDDSMEFTAEPTEEEFDPAKSNPQETEKEWVFEGKDRLLRLGGLITENEKE
jgi:hypothetical protein